MAGTTIGDRDSVGSASIVQQGISALGAGATVYIGETHSEHDGREVCLQIMERPCVQYFCVEYDTDLQAVCSMDELIPILDAQESSSLGHKPPIAMSALIRKCQASGGEVVFMDNQRATSTNRQNHMANKISELRRKITKPGRGVLVLVGSEHLEDINSKGDMWSALQEIVYDGLTFTHGRWGSCVMMWQLS